MEFFQKKDIKNTKIKFLIKPSAILDAAAGWENIGPDTKEYIHSQEYISRVRANSAAQRRYSDKQLNAWEDIKNRKINGENRYDVYSLYEDMYSLSGFNKIWYKIKENTNIQKKAVYKIDLNTNEILDMYESLGEAGRKNNCDSSRYWKSLSWTKKTLWRF